MKHFKTVEFPARTSSILEKTTCDICRGEIAPEYGDADLVSVLHRTGCSYPDGGSGEEVSFDICGDCFDLKLVPWLREQGADPQSRDWDW